MKVLVIPDVHEDLRFLRTILDSEHFNCCDKAVFLGDYFDRRIGQTSNEDYCPIQTATILHDLKIQYPERVDLLCGNHDIAYLALRPLFSGNLDSTINFTITYMLNGEQKIETAKALHEVWDLAFWHALQCVSIYDGILYSHAGIHPAHWPEAGSVEDSLQILKTNWQHALRDLDQKNNALFVCGEARGASVTHHMGRPGGPLWLDWDQEFEDTLPIPQIVGHTQMHKVRQKGRSYCLDCGQTAYGVVTDGKLEVISV